MSIRNMIIWISTIILICSFRSSSEVVINNVKNSQPDPSTISTGENAGYSSPSPGIDLQSDTSTTINEFYDETTKLTESALNVYASTDAPINMPSESKINDSLLNHLITKGTTNIVLNGIASSSNLNMTPRDVSRISSDSITTASNQYSSTTTWPPTVAGIDTGVNIEFDLNSSHYNENPVSAISQEINSPVNMRSIIQGYPLGLNINPDMGVPSITDPFDLNAQSVMNQESLNKPSTPNISANTPETEINNLASFVQNYPSNMNVLNQESSNYNTITDNPSNRTSFQSNEPTINTEINNLSRLVQNFPSSLNVPQNMNRESIHNTGLQTNPSDQTNNGVLSINEAVNTPTQLNVHNSPITLGFNYDDFHDDTFYDEYLSDAPSPQVTPIDESVAASNQSSDINLSYRDDDLYATDFDVPDHLESDENEVFDDSGDFVKNVDFQSLGLDDFDLDYHLGASKEFDYDDDLGDDSAEQENGALDYAADLRNIQKQNHQAVHIKENIWDFADDSKSNEHELSEELIDDPEDFQKPRLNFGLNHIGSGMSSISVGSRPHSNDEYEAEDRNEESLNNYNIFEGFGHSAKYVPRNNVVDNTPKTRRHNIYGQRLATLMEIYNSNANPGANKLNTEQKFNDPNALMNVYNAIMSAKKGRSLKKPLPKTNKTIPGSKGNRAKQIRRLQRIQRLMKIAAKRQGSATPKTAPTEQNNFYKANPSSNLNDIFRHPSDEPQNAIKPGFSNSGSTYEYFPQYPLPRSGYDEIDEAEDDFIEDMFDLAGFNENPTDHSRNSRYGSCPALPIKVNKSLVTIQTANGCEIVITFAANGDQDANLDRDNLDVKVSYRTNTDRK